MENIPHGTVNGYFNLGCRCDLCKQAASSENKTLRAKRLARPLPDDVVHGERKTYTYYCCRCELCKAASRDYMREKRLDLEYKARERQRERELAEEQPDKAAADMRRWREKNREKSRQNNRDAQQRWRLRHYQIEAETEALLLEQQNGACAICGKPDSRKLSIDHCHTTGKIRGLLCRRCNMGLGCFGDDVNALKKAIEYLSRCE